MPAVEETGIRGYRGTSLARTGSHLHSSCFLICNSIIYSITIVPSHRNRYRKAFVNGEVSLDIHKLYFIDELSFLVADSWNSQSVTSASSDRQLYGGF